MTEDLLDFQPGALLRGTPYQVCRKIGAGGMGAVFEVEHVRLKKRLMAKTMHPGLRARQDFVTRMDVEAQTLARIAHPNIVQVHDLGVTDDGIPFFIMEKLEGSDLRKLLRARRYLDLRDALTIIEDVLEALAHAHREGVVHRDIKPENIFLSRSGAQTITKILDFGIVHVMRGANNLTGKRFLGTCQYAAREQLLGHIPSEKTDIYAVGCVLFELVAGRRPFPGPTTQDFIRQHIHDKAPLLSSVAQGIPIELDRLVASALAKDPSERPISALWFASQLHRIQLGAANVVLADANTTEEMLLTAITEGAASSNPIVVAARAEEDETTDRDPGLAAGLRETTPEPGLPLPHAAEDRRRATVPLPQTRRLTREEEFRRARTRTGQPVQIVATEDLGEQGGADPVAARGLTPGPRGQHASRGGGGTSDRKHVATDVVPMEPLLLGPVWRRRAIIATPVIIGLLIATVILIEGGRREAANGAAAASATIGPRGSGAGPSAGAAAPPNPPSLVMTPSAGPAQLQGAGPAAPVTPARPIARPHLAPAVLPSVTGTSPPPSAPAPPTSPPRDDLMRSL